MNTVLVATERDLEHNVLVQALGQDFAIVRSRDGLDALEAARTKPPQVLLVNVSLPKLDGFALYRRLQQDEQLRQIPIVLFSTRSNDVKSERFAQELGAVRFVGNALKPGALDGVLKAALSAKPVAPLPRMPAPVIPLKPPLKPQVMSPPAPTATPPVMPQAMPVTELRTAAPVPPPVVAPPGLAPIVAPAPRPQAVPEPTLKLPALSETAEVSQQLFDEQAQLRQALQAAQQQLDGVHTWQSMFTQSPVATWVVAKNTSRMLAVNDAALRLFAYTQSEFMQLDGPNALRDSGQANTTNVFAFRSKDGRALSLLVNTRDLSFKTQPAELWMAHDVSYRVRGERAMAAELQRVKAILANLPVAYWILNAQAQLADANVAGGGLLGHSREQLLELGLGRLLEEEELTALRALNHGASLALTLRHADGSERKVQFTAGQNEFGEGLRLLTLRVEPESDTVEMPVAQLPTTPKLPAVLEMLRYADDADESTLLQYALAQLAHAFASPVALFASVERITQTMDVVTTHTQSRRRTAATSVALPVAWRDLVTPRSLCCSQEQQESLLVEGLPEMSRYMACSAVSGRELWVLAIANRDAAYTSSEQAEMQDCADILVTLVGRMRQQARLQATTQRSAAASDSMLGLLEKLLDRHDAYAAGSGARVATLATSIAKQMNLAVERQHSLALAARLHDVGHLLIPQTLLLSPGELSVTERALMQSHVELGVNLLNGVDLGADIASIVSQHHERLDGSGYPAALRDDQIMLEARILAVADVMEALCSARSYRAAYQLPVALSELRADSGRGFDAQVVAACEQVFAGNDGRWPV